MGGIAAFFHAFQTDIFQNGVNIAGAQPVDRLMVEIRVGTGFHELARSAQFKRQMPGADGRHALV